jgi:hypothetical protein
MNNSLPAGATWKLSKCDRHVSKVRGSAIILDTASRRHPALLGNSCPAIYQRSIQRGPSRWLTYHLRAAARQCTKGMCITVTIAPYSYSHIPTPSLVCTVPVPIHARQRAVSRGVTLWQESARATHVRQGVISFYDMEDDAQESVSAALGLCVRNWLRSVGFGPVTPAPTHSRISVYHS